MTSDPRALLDAYAEVPNMNVIPLPFTPRSMAPLAFTALSAVLDLHKPHDSFCVDCDGLWPCSTVQAISAALEAS